MTTIEARFRLDWPSFALDVDVSLPGRGVSVFFGPSGSGKTTLLRCIAGLEPRALGRLTVLQQSWQDDKQCLPTYKRPLGYVFQEANLFPHLTVLGNLHYGMRRSKGGVAIGLDQAIELLGINHLLERRPAHLSGGERQRVAIARALAVNPRLLLMDEPLAALDLARKREILPYLERLRDHLEIPLIYVSHAPDEVARLADYLVVMEQGKVQAQGPLVDLLARTNLPIRLGEDAGVVLEGHVAALEPQWHLARIDFAGGSLWTRDYEFTHGRRARVRVLARDVSLAEQPVKSSIQNLLAGHVDAIGGDDHPGSALVRVRVGDSMLLARLTQKAIADLHIVPGKAIWVQVKSVALMD